MMTVCLDIDGALVMIRALRHYATTGVSVTDWMSDTVKQMIAAVSAADTLEDAYILQLDVGYDECAILIRSLRCYVHSVSLAPSDVVVGLADTLALTATRCLRSELGFAEDVPF